MSNIIYIIIAFLLDNFINLISFNNFSYQNFVFVPSFVFVASLILFSEDDFYYGLFKIFIIGIISDVIFLNPIFAYTISYIIAFVLLKLWQKNLGRSMLETIILFTILVFIKEISIYSMYTITNYISMPFESFMINRCIITVILNIFTIIILFFLLEVKINHDNRKAIIRKSNESLFLKRFKI